jgi:chromosome segregation ATPase
MMHEYYTKRELVLSTQIDQIKKEIEKAKSNEFSMIPEGNNRITRIDSKITEVNEEAQKIADEIDSLESQARSTEDSLEKNTLMAEARSKEKKLRQLQSRRIKFSNRQRSVLLRKNKKESLKRRVLAQQEVRAARHEMKAREANDKQMNLEESFVNDLVVDKALEVKRRTNEWKASFDRDVLNNMRNSKFVGIKGARAMAIAKTAGQRLRDRINPALSELSKMIRPEERSSEPRVATR